MRKSLYNTLPRSSPPTQKSSHPLILSSKKLEHRILKWEPAGFSKHVKNLLRKCVKGHLQISSPRVFGLFCTSVVLFQLHKDKMWI